MRFLKTISVILDILILVPGVCGVCSDELGVTFTNPSPCVMRGSSVDIGCSYEYPVGLTVTDTIWFSYSGNTAVLLSEQPSYHGRIEYIGNKHHDCTLRINNIERSDEGDYYFRFFTTGDQRSSKAVYLSVTAELSVQVTPPTVSEGTWVTLTCQTSCKPRPNIVWFKDGQRVPSPVFQATIEDAGSYQCAVEGQETWKSEAVMLDVQCHLVILRVGIGVKLLAVLLLPLVMWWAWKQDSDMDKEEDSPDYVNISGSVGRRRGFISSADQDTRVVEEESNV